MKYLIIFNFLVSISAVSYLIYKKFPFYISVNKTTWCKKIYSITLMMYISRSEYGSRSKGLFTLPIRNYIKIEKWDNEMFKSGEYKNYCA